MNGNFTYMATLPDGTVPPTDAQSIAPWTRVNLTEHVGQTIDHPTPCKKLWYDESPFSYFRTYTARGVGEITEHGDHWPVGWPVRLWLVEPLGETGNWGGRHYPYWVLTHRLKVVAEAEPWRALGLRGAQVLDYLRDELPDQARAWAATYDADPQRTTACHTRWFEYRHDVSDGVSGRMAWRWVNERARSSRREAALHTAKKLTGIALHTTLHDAGSTVSDAAHDYVRTRAMAAMAAVQFGDRLEPEVLDALRGAALDAATASATV